MSERSGPELQLSIDSSEARLSARDSTLQHRNHPLTNCPLLLYPVSISRVVPSSAATSKTTLQVAPAALPAPMHGMAGDGGEASPKFAPRTTAASASEFTHQAIVRLIEAVGRRWDMYSSRERAGLFHGVQQELEDQGHVLPVERIRRKWNNLIVTYKRVKDRSRETGQAKTSWEYYELLNFLLPFTQMMDAMLGKTVGAQTSSQASATLVDIATNAKATPVAELPSSSHMVVTATKPCVFPGGLMATCSPIPTLVQSMLPSVQVAPGGVSSTPGNADAHHPQAAAGPGRLQVPSRVRGCPSRSAATLLVQQNGQAEKHSALLHSLLSLQEEQARLEEERLQKVEARDRRKEKRETRMADTLSRMATAMELVSSKQDTIIALLQRLADKQ
ncbi:hypothetical protein GN956_G8844 [Arapaima gigas]